MRLTQARSIPVAYLLVSCFMGCDAQQPKSVPGAEAALGKAASEATQTYRVQKGDTLFSIAKNLYQDGTKWPEIIRANEQTLRSPSDLSVGQSLIIPKLLPSAEVPVLKQASADLPTTYVVQPGDTLYAIAMRFYGDGEMRRLIVEANRETLENENKLVVGKELQIPANSAEPNSP